jgi:midasin
MASGRFATEAAPAAEEEDAQAQRKRRKVDSAKAALAERWKDFTTVVGDFEHRHVHAAGKGKAKFVFSFVEGPLAQAIRNGDWVLLDEVNLASSETLESLSTLLQAPDSSLVLTEQGDLEPIPRHPEFRLFACMNPATDVGKRDLPVGLRAKFSEIWVPPPDEDRDALRTIVEGYIGRVAVSDRKVVDDVANLYAEVKSLALRAQLADGQNMPPHFSMRTLARALSFASEFAPTFGLRRALYEGFVMAFTMLLDGRSQLVVRILIDKHVVQPAKNPKSIMERVPTMPPIFEKAMRIHHYWLEEGPHEPEEPDDYILTPSVQAKVCDLARAVLTRKVPVLIQGPTSAGKTSVVEYLAKRTGHRFVRINNHEHTDIQEYVGTYVSDPHSGKLVFQEGVLVRALRRGDWIVLDELNLAPTDVLEALNRLLDDNRELVIPETGEVVTPHPHFMLFATQNPPGLYGGRKVLSRAFRNRFLEMHFGDVPKDELKTILERRCRIAPSHAERTVNVFLELQRRRQAGRVFEQKQAFATLRDLFRWGGRGPVESVQQLAEDGYMLLAERARRADDKKVVKEVLEEVLKVSLDEKRLYDFERLPILGLPVPVRFPFLLYLLLQRR